MLAFLLADTFSTCPFLAERLEGFGGQNLDSQPS